MRARITFPAHERDASGRYKIAVQVTIESAEGSSTRLIHVDRYAA